MRASDADTEAGPAREREAEREAETPAIEAPPESAAEPAREAAEPAREKAVEPAREAAREAREPALVRATEPFRPWYRAQRRAASRLFAVSVATIAASAGLIGWTLWSWPVQRAPRAPAPADTPEPVAVAAAADSGAVLFEAEAPTARLASDDPVGEAIARVSADGGESPIRGVAAAVDEYGVIAAWTDRVLWVSRDDGRSFQQQLAAPEPLGAVAIGPEGRVYAARRGGRIAMLSPAGHTRWLDIGCQDVLAIGAAPLPAADAGAGAPWLAVLGLHADSADGAAPLLWLSADHGRSWRALIAPHHGDAANRVRVSTDGVIDIVTEDSDTSVASDAGPRFRHYTGHVDGRPFELRASSDDAPLLGPAHDGQTWEVEHRGRQARLAPAVTSRAMAGLAVRNWDVRLAAGREHTFAAADGKLLQLAPGRPRVLTRSMPDDASGWMAIDGLDRAVITVGGSVVRHSTAHGWRRLFEIPGL
ncbi:MAG TPA: hypothetical protein VKB80_25105 [Kofleriaceae bacterium]|nr:hypothetical protein [Kofleriaceae bacterium]